MKKYLLVFVSVFLVIISSAQTIERSVVANSGNSDANAQVQVDWTLGEITTETLEIMSMSISQGFHQTMLDVSAIEEVLELDLRIYPNPTNDYVRIEISNHQEGLNYYLYDINGKMLVFKNNINPIESINMSGLSENTYFLIILEEKEKIRNTYKIEKIK
jgi:hypothetical protein